MKLIELLGAKPGFYHHLLSRRVPHIQVYRKQGDTYIAVLFDLEWHKFSPCFSKEVEDILWLMMKAISREGRKEV